MKVKLLKKIRKRFSILEYSEMSSNPSSSETYAEEKFGLPFYFVKDNAGWFDCDCYKTFDEAHSDIRDKVLGIYSERFHHKPAKVKKVWWVK